MTPEELMKQHPRLDYGMAELLCWYADRPELLEQVIEKAKTLPPKEEPKEYEIKCIELVNGEA